MDDARPTDTRLVELLDAGFVDASGGHAELRAARSAVIDRMLSFEAPVDDWDVMKAQILESRYPPLPE